MLCLQYRVPPILYAAESEDGRLRTSLKKRGLDVVLEGFFPGTTTACSTFEQWDCFHLMPLPSSLCSTFISPGGILEILKYTPYI